MRWRAAFAHPLGVTLLCGSATLALGLVALPPLARWGGQAGTVLLLGAAAYAATLLVVAWPRAAPAPPALRQAHAIRRAMAARLAGEDAAASAFGRTLAEALDHLDRRLLPTLEEVARRSEALGGQLARYERGELPPPGDDALARLRTIHRRQQAAMAACVREAANADAALLALVVEADEEAVAAEARRWSGYLGSVHDALVEVLQES